MIGIVDYGLGNLRSVAGAVERLDETPVISADPAVLGQCAKLILPGVGAFGDGMQNLRDRGLVGVLEGLVVRGGRPILGICLGAQLMAKSSEEFGTHEGLGWLNADIRRLRPDDPSLRVPHVGWDDLERIRPCPLFDGLPETPLFYYVHSYCIQANDPAILAGACTYGERFSAVLHSANVMAVQFHPEKSQKDGLTLLRNFLAL